MTQTKVKNSNVVKIGAYEGLDSPYCENSQPTQIEFALLSPDYDMAMNFALCREITTGVLIHSNDPRRPIDMYGLSRNKDSVLCDTESLKLLVKCPSVKCKKDLIALLGHTSALYKNISVRDVEDSRVILLESDYMPISSPMLFSHFMLWIRVLAACRGEYTDLTALLAVSEFVAGRTPSALVDIHYWLLCYGGYRQLTARNSMFREYSFKNYNFNIGDSSVAIGIFSWMQGIYKPRRRGAKT